MVNEKLKQIKFWRVKAKFGHVGYGKYIEIDVPCKAITDLEAISKVKNIGGVKHDIPNVISRITEITFEEYIKLKREYKNHPYIKGKTNAAIRNVYKNEIKEKIKNLQRFSRQKWNNHRNSTKFKQNRGNLMIEEANREIQSYMNLYY